MPGAKHSIPILPLPSGGTDDVSGNTDEWHIAGVLVHVRPGSLDDVRAAIEGMTGAEIHAASDTGKLVVTLEAPSSRAIAAHLTYLHQLDGVLGATLVYQHNEDACAMHEEIVHDTHSPGLY